ncbi:MAG: hypothetical protein OXF76_11750 [Caldilineaceae bacterium]|nr:hypothetical protein [Caldilineaceae bacterium]
MNSFDGIAFCFLAGVGAMKCPNMVIHIDANARALAFRNSGADSEEEVFNIGPANVRSSWAVKKTLQCFSLFTT